VVDVKSDRLKVEIAEGVFGICKMTAETEQEAAQGTASKTDISTLTAMLAARWKSGPDIAAENKVPKIGQIRQFRIASLDAQAKRIQLESVD
jgi:small subunit ribosomal protein S1